MAGAWSASTAVLCPRNPVEAGAPPKSPPCQALDFQQAPQNAAGLRDDAVDDRLTKLRRSGVRLADHAGRGQARIVGAPGKARAAIEDQGRDRLLVGWWARRLDHLPA